MLLPFISPAFRYWGSGSAREAINQNADSPRQCSQACYSPKAAKDLAGPSGQGAAADLRAAVQGVQNIADDVQGAVLNLVAIRQAPDSAILQLHECVVIVLHRMREGVRVQPPALQTISAFRLWPSS